MAISRLSSGGFQWNRINGQQALIGALEIVPKDWDISNPYWKEFNTNYEIRCSNPASPGAQECNQVTLRSHRKRSSLPMTGFRETGVLFGKLCFTMSLTKEGISTPSQRRHYQNPLQGKRWSMSERQLRSITIYNSQFSRPIIRCMYFGGIFFAQYNRTPCPRPSPFTEPIDVNLHH